MPISLYRVQQNDLESKIAVTQSLVKVNGWGHMSLDRSNSHAIKAWNGKYHD